MTAQEASNPSEDSPNNQATQPKQPNQGNQSSRGDQGTWTRFWENWGPWGWKEYALVALIGLVVLIGAYGVFVFLTEPSQAPESVNITNKADRAFTVSWMTREKQTKGYVIVSEKDSFTPVISRVFGDKRRDERDLLVDKWNEVFGTNRRYYTHIVHIEDLEPEKEYFIRIGSGNRLYGEDKDEGSDWASVWTLKTLEDTVTPDPAYGRVVTEDGKNPAPGALVFMRLEKENGDKSTLLSCLTKENGTWVIETSNARTSDGLKAFGSLGSDDKEVMWVDTEFRGQAKEVEIDPEKDQPAPDITLEGDLLSEYVERQSEPGRRFVAGLVSGVRNVGNVRMGKYVNVEMVVFGLLVVLGGALLLSRTLLRQGFGGLRYLAVLVAVVGMMGQGIGVVWGQEPDMEPPADGGASEFIDAGGAATEEAYTEWAGAVGKGPEEIAAGVAAIKGAGDAPEQSYPTPPSEKGEEEEQPAADIGEMPDEETMTGGGGVGCDEGEIQIGADCMERDDWEQAVEGPDGRELADKIDNGISDQEVNSLDWGDQAPILNRLQGEEGWSYSDAMAVNSEEAFNNANLQDKARAMAAAEVGVSVLNPDGTLNSDAWTGVYDQVKGWEVDAKVNLAAAERLGRQIETPETYMDPDMDEKEVQEAVGEGNENALEAVVFDEKRVNEYNQASFEGLILSKNVAPKWDIDEETMDDIKALEAYKNLPDNQQRAYFAVAYAKGYNGVDKPLLVDENGNFDWDLWSEEVYDDPDVQGEKLDDFMTIAVTIASPAYGPIPTKLTKQVEDEQKWLLDPMDKGAGAVLESMETWQGKDLTELVGSDEWESGKQGWAHYKNAKGEDVFMFLRTSEGGALENTSVHETDLLETFGNILYPPSVRTDKRPDPTPLRMSKLGEMIEQCKATLKDDGSCQVEELEGEDPGQGEKAGTWVDSVISETLLNIENTALANCREGTMVGGHRVVAGERRFFVVETEGCESTSGSKRLIGNVMAQDDEEKNIAMFIDKNSNGEIDEGELLTADTPGVFVSVIEEERAETYDLQQGWNYVSFPMIPQQVYKASDLLREIASQDGYATTVSTYYSGKWHTYKQRGDVVFSDEDFNIVPGRGYAIRAVKPTQFVLSGDQTKESVPMDLMDGWNMVGVHPGKETKWAHAEGDDGWMAVELMDRMRDDGMEASVVTDYVSGKYESVIKDKDNAGQLLVYGRDYDLEETKAYFVRVNSGGKVWQP